MQKVNVNEIAETSFKSPKGKYESFDRDISLELGRDPNSTDAKTRHPFDLGMVRIPPGATAFPFHLESAQWEMYLVVSGRGSVRDERGIEEVVAGDSFIFAPGEAHQLLNRSEEDFVYYVIADNPVGDSCYYPDSDKWLVRAGDRREVLQAKAATYFDGEE